VKDVPEDASTDNAHPVAVPALEKSDAVTESTLCEKVREKVIGEVVFV
jgi:hypothetical protein